MSLNSLDRTPSSTALTSGNMYYAPHTLQRRIEQKIRDAHNRVVSVDPVWEDVCMCRCDDSGDREFRNENGELYRPKYHIVLDGKHREVKAGDYVRCLDGIDVRGEGVVVNVKVLNYLNYSEAWV